MRKLLVVATFSLVLIACFQAQQITGPERPTAGTRLYLETFDNPLIDSFTMIEASQFFDTQNNILWCQSANNGTTIGEWFFPDGTEVSTVDSPSHPLHVYHDEGQVGLLRDGGLGTPSNLQGLYKCVIPDENDVNQTLWVAAYRDAFYDGDMRENPAIERNTDFSLNSTTRDADPPVFTLSFNVTKRPPTNVSCTVSGNQFNIDDEDLKRIVIDALDPLRVLVIVTVRMRKSGIYQCTVTTGVAVLADAMSMSVTLTVTGTPTNLTVMRTGLYQAMLSWSPPTSNDPMVQGYEVFYDSPNGMRFSTEVKENTTLTLVNISPELSYSTFVVAYGGDLPSEASNANSIGEAVSMDAPSRLTVGLDGTDVKATCTLYISIELSSVQLVWFLDGIVNSTEHVGGGAVSLSLDLNLDSVNASDAGLYTCGAMVTDALGDMANITRDYELFVQLPDPIVNINVGPGTNLNRTFISGRGFVSCNAEVVPIDVPRNVSISWYGPEGQISKGEKYELMDPFQDAANVFIGPLIINSLENSDNLTEYYCTVEFRVNDTSSNQRLSDFVIPGRKRSQNVSLIVEALPVPIVTVMTTQGTPIIGEAFFLNCSAEFDRNIATITLEWLKDGSSIVSSNSDGVLTLNISSVNVSDNGMYTCVATLDIDGLTSTANNTYEFLILDDPVVDITASGSNVAGSTYTLICTVNVATGTPNITWTDPDGVEVDEMFLTLTEADSEFTLTLQFISLNYSDVGLYTCIANLSIPDLDFFGMGSYSTLINIQIPTPSVTVTADSRDDFIRGTVRSITCNISPNPPLPANIGVTHQWKKNGVTLDSSSDRVEEGSLQYNNGSMYSSTITFSPLNTTDGGEYQCIGTVSPTAVEENILHNNASDEFQIIVADIPVSNVTLIANGTGALSEPYSLMCSVDLPEGLVGVFLNLTIEKLANGTYEVLEYSAGTSVIVSLSSLTTSDAGMYKCSLDIRLDAIGYQRTFDDFLNITVTIPSPVVGVTTDPVNPGELIEGTYINLVCNISADEAVDTDIDVTVEWSKNGSTLNNGTDYIISEVVESSGYYISTVRIAELTAGDSVFKCSVIVVSSIGTYIAGSSGSSDINISVREFKLSDVKITVSFSSTPTAGDLLKVTCSATVPDRLVHSPDNVIISYDNTGAQQVVLNNLDATESNVTSGENVFTKCVTINPVKTSDARRYFCVVPFSELLLLAVPVNVNELSVYIPPPSMSVSLTPSGTIYESTLLVIVCIATLPSVVDTDVTVIVIWIRPNGTVISSDERVAVGQVSSPESNTFQSNLTFTPVDNGDKTDNETNDNGNYTCRMDISSTDSMIPVLSAFNSVEEEIIVADLPEIKVEISTSGSTEVGQKLNITCTVTLVEGFVGNLTSMWDDLDVDMSVNIQNFDMIRTSDGSSSVLTIVLDPVQFDYRGTYICEAMFNTTFTNDDRTNSQDHKLIVDIPPFDVTISQSYYDPLYAGTNLTITCNITLSNLVDIPIIVSNVWTRDGSEITQTTITEDLVKINNLNYIASLEFFPLNALTDDGEYKCSVRVIPSVMDEDDYMYITNVTNNASTALDVLNLPNPVVTVSRSSLDSVPGDSFEFICNVSVVDRLIVSPEITWSKVAGSTNNPLPEDDISVDPVLDNNLLSLTFTSLNTSDAGRYTCEAVLTISQISIVRSNNTAEDLTLQIPTPDVTVTRSQTSNTLLAGSKLTVYCDIRIDPKVDTLFSVDTLWTSADNDEMIDAINSTLDRVTVYDPWPIGFNQYRSRVEFSTLSSIEDSGLYRCEVVIDSNSTYTYVFDSGENNSATTFNVTDPEIGNFFVPPGNFLGLETTCPDSNPYDSFTLNCSASKPMLVLPELEIFWLHNGTLRSNNSFVYNGTHGNTVHKLNVLRFPTSVPEDSGTYQCVARLIIPDSNNISVSDVRNVTIRAAERPLIPIDVNTSVAETSANITFTIPAIAYTPEQYHIEFIGMELQNNLTNSTVISGTGNITATDLVYTITLNGLEEANSYNFSVVSTNCQGSTRTQVENFTTLPAAPNGTVRNCGNTTFNPRNVTLSWDPPLRELQNGEITGYELLCKEEGSSVPVPDTNGTLDSTETNYTIPVITPFRFYNCSLSAINGEGTGPAAFCTFNSAQDSPGDAPRNFSSTAGRLDAVFTWTAPGTPNGIVTQYNLTVSIYSTVREDSVNTSSYLIDAVDDTTPYSMRVSGLVPYQNYKATIAARTVVGYGPEDDDAGRTDPDISSAVDLLTVPAPGYEDIRTLPAVDDNTLNVTWRPPKTPNGFISHYNIDVTSNEARSSRRYNVSSVVGRDQYTYLVNSLESGVLYNITIGAVNEVGQGENVSVIAFASNSDPDVAPENIESERSSDGTMITVSWDPVSLEDAGGFFKYVITATSDERKRQSDPQPVEVRYNETSGVVSGLDPPTSYTVTVSVRLFGVNTAETTDGPTTAPIVVEPNPEHTDSPAGTAAPSSIIPIIGGIVAAVVVVIIVVIVIIVAVACHRRRTGKASFISKGQHNDLFELSPTNGGTVLRALDQPPEHDLGATNGVSSGTSFAPLQNEKDVEDEEEEDPKKKLMEEDQAHLEAEKALERMKPIAKASFHEHVLQLHEDADKGYENEYKSIPMSTESAIDSAKEESNKPKNRFANIFPYDYTRVKLPEVEGVPGSDYINASYVDGYNLKDCYVCAQGPLPTTVSDFWRMIWEKRLTNIVMLTGVIEGGKKKCEQYWPETVGETVDMQGGLHVTMTSRVPFSDYTIHSLKVSKPEDKDATPLEITHYHFTAWPDHGVPQFATSLISFINRVQKGHDKTRGVPLVVHCSAGVGRTGTFVALDSMMDRLRVQDSLNVYEFLRQMRSKRMYMIQTLAQYVFVHDALDEYITCGETHISASNLKVRVSKMHKNIPSKGISGFQEQYQLLEQVCYVPNESTYSDAKKPCNLPKNRYPDIVPLNLNRPRLRPDGSEGSDYINASFVDGYKQRNAYLVTQGPLKNTTDDFWRLVVEFKSRNIVMLCNTVEEGEEKCYMYWPTKEGEPVEYGKHKVTLQSETPSGDYTIRKFLIQNEKSSAKAEREGVTVTQFHYTVWSEHGIPSGTGQIIEMIDMLTRSQMNTGNKPITVVCNDGVGRSGAFLCIHSQLEKIKTEGEIDVFKYLKSARTKRIGLVSELNHYVFIHQVLADYVESFDPYANFKD